MQRYRGEHQHIPPDSSEASEIAHIPQAQHSYAHVGAFTVRSIDVLSAWGAEDLHALIAGGQEQCAQDVDDHVVRSAHPGDLG